MPASIQPSDDGLKVIIPVFIVDRTAQAMKLVDAVSATTVTKAQPPGDTSAPTPTLNDGVFFDAGFAATFDPGSIRGSAEVGESDAGSVGGSDSSSGSGVAGTSCGASVPDIKVTVVRSRQPLTTATMYSTIMDEMEGDVDAHFLVSLTQWRSGAVTQHTAASAADSSPHAGYLFQLVGCCTAVVF